jgi:hypothetical protein
MDEFAPLSRWLAHTELSSVIQSAAWIIPAIQTIHILAVAVVITSMFMLDLRLIGAFARNEASGAIASRLLPWAWGALALLAVSGSLLIVAEPERCLPNRAFWAKMLMLAAALLMLWVLQRGLRRNPAYWEGSAAHRRMSGIIAAASLVLWSGVVLAGRWIAYLKAG